MIGGRQKEEKARGGARRAEGGRGGGEEEQVEEEEEEEDHRRRKIKMEAFEVKYSLQPDDEFRKQRCIFFERQQFWKLHALTNLVTSSLKARMVAVLRVNIKTKVSS